MTTLILASQSPRRAELLRSAGYRFEVRPAVVSEPEPRSAGQIAQHWAEALSYFKARSVARDLQHGYVLGADTLVALGDLMFGKPRDRQDARRILQALSGTTHRVITGVTVWDVAGRRRLIRHAETTVTMRPLSPEDLEAYLDSGMWEGKAGAYGIQDPGDDKISRIDGSYSNVVGLPLELVEELLGELGILDDVRGARVPGS